MPFRPKIGLDGRQVILGADDHIRADLFQHGPQPPGNVDKAGGGASHLSPFDGKDLGILEEGVLQLLPGAPGPVRFCPAGIEHLKAVVLLLGLQVAKQRRAVGRRNIADDQHFFHVPTSAALPGHRSPSGAHNFPPGSWFSDNPPGCISASPCPDPPKTRKP